MKRLVTRLATALFTVTIAGALAFGVTRALSSPASESPALSCELGGCPPNNNESCNEICLGLDSDGGGCLHGCCTCLE